MAVTGDPGAFDPYLNATTSSLAALAYDSLVHVQPDGKVVSGLAGTWDVDAHHAKFTLREGVTCSDGAALTASQVAAAITFAGDPDNGAYLYGLRVPALPFKATGVDATRTVEIDMKAPFGFLVNTVGVLPIVCAKGMKDRKLLVSKSDGTGPYVLSEVTSGQSYTFTVRKDYRWGPGGAGTNAPGTPAKVVLRVLENESTAANLLLSGQLNFAAIGADDAERLKAKGLTKVDVPGPGAWLWFNQIGGRPTAEKAVRQALVQALDLNDVIKINTKGTGGKATGLISMGPNPCSGDTLAGQLPGFDVAAAESLLDQTGWTKGADGVRRKNGKPLELDLHYVPAMPSNDKQTAEYVAQKWGAIGVKVHLAADTLIGRTQVLYENSNYDVHMFGFGVSLPSQAMRFVSGPVPPKGRNIAGIDVPRYGELAAKAITMTPPASCQYWRQAEQALWQGVNPVPIAQKPWVYYLRNARAQATSFDIPIPTSLRVLG